MKVTMMMLAIMMIMVLMIMTRKKNRIRYEMHIRRTTI